MDLKSVTKQMNHSRIMFAAPKSGSGKTLITCALLAALKRRGYRVHAFKCGPDYIDPMFHEKVLATPSVNLDTWFTGKEQTKQLFERHMQESGAEIAVIEGVMGLYDGLGGVTEEASSYDLASVLGAPVILVVDANGMGRSLIAEIKGFQSMDRNHLISGVILNKTSASFAKLISPEIRESCGIPVIGSFPKSEDFHINSRHLGLKLPEEILDLKKEVERAADVLEKNVDIDLILLLAGFQRECQRESGGTGSKPLSAQGSSGGKRRELSEFGSPIPDKNRSSHVCVPVRIGVAQDEAFCFYYEDNLKLLEKLGAEIVFFSLIHDQKLPEGIQGIYLGGGYPELKARELSANLSMRESVDEAIRRGMPSIAECGGFMYLHEFMEPIEKTSESAAAYPSGIRNQYPMVGVVHGGCRYTKKLVRFGYCSITEHQPTFLPKGKEIRGHEFHYYDSDDNGVDCTAVKPVSGRSWECIHETNHSFWGYPHLYWLSAPEFAEHFVECCRDYGSVRK